MQFKTLLKTLLKSKTLSQKSLDEFIDNLSKEFGELSSKQIEQKIAQFLVNFSKFDDKEFARTYIEGEIERLKFEPPSLDLGAAYINQAKLTTQNLSQSAQKDGIKFSFDSIDNAAINAMENSFYWLKTEFNENLTKRLKDMIKRVYEGKISHLDIGSALREEFDNEIKGSKRYFEGVARHILLQSANVARVNQASKNGIKYYKILAIMDSHTTPICRSMHGRIIPALHIENQAKILQNAKTIAEKKSAAIWRSEAYFGRSDKLSSNFGLPPYHFNCRTEAVPVWVDEREIDGVKMRGTLSPSDDEILRHIDKTGVERIWQKSNTHILKKHDEATLQNVIKALNSINTIAPNSQIQNYTNAISDNGYFLVFNSDKLVTAYKPSDNKKESFEYFKRKSMYNEKEIIKWKIANLI